MQQNGSNILASLFFCWLSYPLEYKNVWDKKKTEIHISFADRVGISMIAFFFFFLFELFCCHCLKKIHPPPLFLWIINLTRSGKQTQPNFEAEKKIWKTSVIKRKMQTLTTRTRTTTTTVAIIIIIIIIIIIVIIIIIKKIVQ